jgi:hypothetical protein
MVGADAQATPTHRVKLCRDLSLFHMSDALGLDTVVVHNMKHDRCQINPTLWIHAEPTREVFQDMRR